MRLRRAMILLWLAALPTFAQQVPPDVEQVLAKCAAALGGQAAVAKVASLHMKGSVEIVNTGTQGSVEILVKAPARRAAVYSLQGVGVMRSGYNGATGWYQPLGYPPLEAGGALLADLRRSAGIAPALQLKQAYTRLELQETAAIEGRDAYVVVATTETGRQEKWYFDTRTALPVRLEAWTEEGLPSESNFSDYRDVEGVRFPFTVRQYTPVYQMLTRFQSIRVNVPVDDSIFERPR